MKAVAAIFLLTLSIAPWISLAKDNQSSGPASVDPRDEFDVRRPKLVLSVLTSKEADRLFEEFKSRQYLAFDYLPGCCHARATEMTLIADQKSINMGKVFVEGRLGVRSGESKYFPVEFNWHVAPTVWVKGPSGRELMAFDPAFFDKPVSIEVFKRRFTDKIIGRAESEITSAYFASKYQNKNKAEEGKKYEYLQADLKQNREDLKFCLEKARERPATAVEERALGVRPTTR